MMLKTIEGFATVATILSLYLLSESILHGFTVGVFGNLLWLYWAHEKPSYGIFITNLILFIINLNGLGVWK